jgi:hypothetical protein
VAGPPPDWAATVWLMHGCRLRIGEALAVNLRCRINWGETLRVKEQVNPAAQLRPLKFRQEGEFRDIPLPHYVSESIDKHVAEYGTTSDEGTNGQALAALGSIDEDSLTELLLDVFDPPLQRLEKIARQPEQTGTLNARTVTQLRQVVDVMTSTPAGPDLRTAQALAFAADVFSTRAFQNAATALGQAADILPHYARRMGDSATKMIQAADAISASAVNPRRNGSR